MKRMTPAKNKKILIITYFFDAQPGFSDFLYRVNLMREFGEVLVLSNKKIAKSKLQLSNDEFIYLGSGLKSKLGFLVYLLKGQLVCLCIRPAFILLLHTSLSVFRYLFRNKTPCFLVWNIHPSQFFETHSKKNNLILRYLSNKLNSFLKKVCYKGAKLCSATMPVGEALEEELITKAIPRDKLRLVYLGVDDMFIPSFVKKKIETNTPLKLLYAGSLTKERGLYIMLKALAFVNSGGLKATLLIVGCSETARREILRIADELKIRGYITIEGILDYCQMPSRMHSADIGLQLLECNTYFSMSPPSKLFEYLVSGLPAIVNDIPTHNLYVEDNETGFIIQYDPEDLAERISYICENKHIIPEMSSNCRKASGKYRWVHQAEKIRRIVGDYA